MLAVMDISIPPSGTGLPAGSGNAAQGAKVYEAKCQTCHGPKGVGKPADALVGGIGSLASGKPMIWYTRLKLSGMTLSQSPPGGT